MLSDLRVDRYDDLLYAPGARQALLDHMRQTVLVDPRRGLATIGAPTLLFSGERDTMISIANAADYLRAMPLARIVSVCRWASSARFASHFRSKLRGF